jgi:hypothetical protein
MTAVFLMNNEQWACGDRANPQPLVDSSDKCN